MLRDPSTLILNLDSKEKKDREIITKKTKVINDITSAIANHLEMGDIELTSV